MRKGSANTAVGSILNSKASTTSTDRSVFFFIRRPPEIIFIHYMISKGKWQEKNQKGRLVGI
jgi:hypothetical protein